MSRWKLALAVVLVVVVGILGWRLLQRAPQDASKDGSSTADAPIPVTVEPAVTQDVPVYLTALGTVQALNTVTVNAQVSGQLKALHFAEGLLLA